MSSSTFKSKVVSKSDDELVDIILNKDEYKEELVAAAEVELRKRRTTNPVGSRQQEIPDTKEQLREVIQELKTEQTPKERSMGVYLATVLSFLMFPIWILIVITQSGLSAISDNAAMGYLAIFNFFVTVIRLVLGFGIYNMRPWGYSWGLPTAVLNLVLMGYQAANSGSQFFIFLTISEALVAGSLFWNKQLFIPAMNDTEETDKKVAPIADQAPHYESEIPYEKQKELDDLHELIQNEKSNYFGKSNKDEIVTLLSDLITTKERAEDTLSAYQAKFKQDLLNDLKDLTSNYDTMKTYLEKFIQFEVVEAKYPHDRISK